MVEKKLITLACAAGILACGACFLPPPPDHPPPPRLELRGIQSIRIEASNVSKSRHLDPSALAWGVAGSINERTRITGVSATAQTEAGTTDAVLQIIVVSESAQTFPSGGNRLSLLVRISATLTRQDGQVMWRETDAEYPGSYHFTSANSADIWNEPDLQNSVASTVGTWMARCMFDGY
jgi:hypothetical protein